MPKYSIEDVKKIPPATLLKLIQRAKDYLKTNNVFQDMCKEWNTEPSIIDIVPVKFGDLEVSARTERGIITLNYKLLCDGDFFKDYHYLIHEVEHFFQQTMGDKPTKGADDGDYLHNPFEQEGFKRQVQYIDDQFGEDEAEEYVDHLLDHHNKDGKERDKLEEKLMDKVEKTAQHTKLDEETVKPTYRWEPEQKILPFEDWQVQSDIENMHRYPKKQKLTDPLSIKYPELSPEQLKYKQLSEQQLQRFREEDDDDYKNQQSQYWRKDQPFISQYQSYYDLNKALPDDVKKQVLDQYNKLRAVSAKFMESYKEANALAAAEPTLDLNGTYFDLFKRFGHFIAASLRKGVGQLFGIIGEKARSHHNETSRATLLIQFINKGVNIFNITPLNVQSSLHDMTTAIENMELIMAEFEKRKKILKKLPEEINSGVKSFLLKKEHRQFLKWLDEYFPNDKQDFIEGMAKDVLSMSKTDSRISIGSLRKINTFVDIYYRSKKHATRELYESLERKTENALQNRLAEEFQQRLTPKIKELTEIVQSTTPDNIGNLVKFVYRKYGLDLRSTLQFVNIAIGDKHENDDKEVQKQLQDVSYKKFLASFIDDLRGQVQYFEEKLNSKDYWAITQYVEKFLRAHKSTGVLDRDALSKYTEKDLNDQVDKYIHYMIINQMPNFESKHNDNYTYPSFKGIGKILKQTGKFSIDSIVNFVHSKVPFVPKEFLLDLAKATFKGKFNEKYKGQEDLMSQNMVFETLSNMNGTNLQLTMRVLLDMLKRTNKMNPQIFTFVFLKNFDDIQRSVSNLSSDLRNRLKDDEARKKTKNYSKYNEALSKQEQDITANLLSSVFRGQDTVAKDKENIDKFISFIHNSAGNLSPKEMGTIITNNNFQNYAKTGIVKKLFNAYVTIKNLGGYSGIVKKFGKDRIEQLKQDGFISKNFQRNLSFIVRAFNSGDQISPASPMFKQLFQACSAIETDLQALDMADAYKDLLDNHKPKDDRLYRLNFNINDRLRFRVLKDKDPRALRVGIESDCCQRIGGIGEVAARDSFVNRLAGVLLLEWKDSSGDWEMLTQSYFHYVPEKNGYILDNIEYNRDNTQKSGVNLPAAYAYLAQKIGEKFDVGYFLAGKSYSKIDTSAFKTSRLKGGDPRYFDSGSYTSDRRTPYTDFSASDSMDLQRPSFELEKQLPGLLGQPQPEEMEVESMFDISRHMIRLATRV